MPKVTFRAVPVVCVIIKGEKVEGVESNLPLGREDGGLVKRFLAFQGEEKIYPALHGGSSGAGQYVGFFTAENAAKIEAWLLEQGAKRGKWRA